MYHAHLPLSTMRLETTVCCRNLSTHGTPIARDTRQPPGLLLVVIGYRRERGVVSRVLTEVHGPSRNVRAIHTTFSEVGRHVARWGSTHGVPVLMWPQWPSKRRERLMMATRPDILISFQGLAADRCRRLADCRCLVYQIY